MSVKIYCKLHDDVHTLDAGSAVALIYTYQRTMAELAFETPLAPVEPFATEHKLLETLCPKEDIEKLCTFKVKNYKRSMGQHRRRLTIERRKKPE